MLTVAACGGLIWLTNQPSVRVSTIRVSNGTEAFAEFARTAMQGKYLGLIPRDSIFFVPEHAIRVRILDTHPEIAAVSISRDGMTGILITPNVRVPVARWCGLKKTIESVPEYCYFFDSSGFIYAAVDAASSTQPLNSFALYTSLEGATEEPLRATLKNTSALPQVFDFARQLLTLGSPVASITIHDDEVDCVLASGTRITYVRGREEKSFAALVSAKQNLNLTDGSLEYVDVRFDGKVYLKRKEKEAVQL
ncbi:MAG TPA: hypothetical protein VM103_02720 [Candidatus Paceibacterota bacterium]|nr:hypothetical protein [Candidatus Paceibacterota bacterium]